mgnify:CR=1 FL=1
MVESPLISVIIPFVNHESHIENAYSWMQKQSLLDWELLFIDNGATDNSRSIADSISGVDQRVRVVDQSTKGIAPARNKGLEEARGKYVSFLDVDDHFHPEKLEKLSRIMERYPEVGMAFGKTERIYLGTDKVVIQDWGVARKGVNAPPDLAIDWATNFYRLPQTGATLVRTDVARAVGGFPEDMTLGNDDVGWHIEIALRYPIYFHPEVVVHYYRHQKSEGARLNQAVLVEQRYLDAHLRYTHPRGLRWKKEMKDPALLARSEKGITGNVISLIRKGREIPPLPPSLHPYYRRVIRFHQDRPFRWANLYFKVTRRFRALFQPDRFPLR